MTTHMTTQEWLKDCVGDGGGTLVPYTNSKYFVHTKTFDGVEQYILTYSGKCYAIYVPSVGKTFTREVDAFLWSKPVSVLRYREFLDLQVWGYTSMVKRRLSRGS